MKQLLTLNSTTWIHQPVYRKISYIHRKSYSVYVKVQLSEESSTAVFFSSYIVMFVFDNPRVGTDNSTQKLLQIHHVTIFIADMV